MKELLQKIVGVGSIEYAKTILDEHLKSERIDKAYRFAIKAHEGQFRKSGEEYVIHPILVASIVARLSMDEDMVIAALLHDVVEDTPYELEDVRAYGDGVTLLVEGLTKIDEIRDKKLLPSYVDEKLLSSAMSFRKMLITSIEDVRVLVIKLCDRLHNMLTLDALPKKKQRRIAEETLVVYAPIAHRLGISVLKNLLEDKSFYYIFPEEYAKIDAYLDDNTQDYTILLNSFIEKLEKILVQYGLKDKSFKVFGRVKHYYSIYLKQQRKGISVDEVLDLFAVRVITEDSMDCYKALGAIHLNFKPLIARFKDYISAPKDNGYQTIHTSVFDNENIYEIQIRSQDMHHTAEFGVAAHWKYKEGTSQNIKLDWLKNLQYQHDNVEEFYELAKNDLFSNDVTVLSPNGDQYTLPRGAVALDFAYMIHSEVGQRAKAVYINKERATLLTELKNGDVIRIDTADEPIYRCSWIDTVQTSRARHVMKIDCRHRIKEVDMQVGYKLLQTAIQRDDLASWVQQKELEKNLYKVPNKTAFFKNIVKSYLNDNKDFKFLPLFQRNKKLKSLRKDNFIFVTNRYISSVEFDYCCHPKYGDPVVAFLEGSKAAIHHKLCKNAYSMLQDSNKQMVFVQWTEDRLHKYNLIISLKNEKGSLAKVLQKIAEIDINVLSIQLGAAYSEQANFCEMKVESKYKSSDELREVLEHKIKLVELISAKDAYNK
ncbi:MAG: RelA/SpoT family protein [Campylobacterota bacterium]